MVIEGTDFSGKSTQYEKLTEKLKALGYSFGQDSFPNYDSGSSFFVKAYLRGEFGLNAMDIKPEVASSFYTLDRYASYKTRPWGDVYRNNGNILFARYITSNILHQASKYDKWEEKKKFIDWLYSYEVDLFGIPKEDCVILLDMPPYKAQQLKKQRLKEQNGLTSSGSVEDIHENDRAYLEKSYNTAKEVADYLNWYVVSCLDDSGELRTIEDIHSEVLGIVLDIYN